MHWFCNSKKELTHTPHRHPVCVPGFQTLRDDGVPEHIVQGLIDIWGSDPDMTPVDDDGNRIKKVEKLA